MKYIFFTLLVLAWSEAFSQKKFEKETRIQESEVPTAATEFVNAMNLGTKIKWYKEQGYDRMSFEAKTKYQGQRLSIEFSEDGTFEDMEILTRQDEVPGETYKVITQYFSTTYKKHKIRKIQVQYTGKIKLFKHFFKQKEAPPELKRRYEVVVSAKENGAYQMFEYLFDSKGKFLQKSVITLKPSDNIEF
jgi:hypothetical protein